tara:strand:+ start:20800 stop:20973 length:174 start_codon:yes stop_codon:yes gene_type:complete
MSSEVSTRKTTKTTQAKRGKRASQAQSNELDSRRRLEERLEDIRLARELKEFDFEYC